MDISLILKLTGLGILVSTACQILKKSGHDEQAIFVSVTGIAIGFMLVVDKISELIQLVKEVFSL